jgi:hypothetical protein
MGGKKVKRPQRAQRRKTGKMEYWNIGMLGKGNKMPKPIIPSFHHSIIPIHLPCGLWERKFFSFF